jgi:DNA-binding ferritin-like protein
MKSFMQFVDEQVKGIDAGSSKSILQEVLAVLNAVYWSHQHSHWQVKGDNYYGNHLLFQRLYENTQDEIDSLGEKLVAYFGEDAVAQKDIFDKTKKWMDKWDKEDPLKRGIVAEETLQKVFKTAYDSLKKKNDMSLGLDDFIMATANAHETHLYLLGQVKK